MFVRQIVGQKRNAVLNALSIAERDIQLIGRAENLDDEDKSAVADALAEIDRLRRATMLP